MTKNTPTFVPEVLTTEQAATTINRTPQTLRKWSCLGNGPILKNEKGQPPVRLKPININGRLAWRRSDLEALIGRPLTLETTTPPENSAAAPHDISPGKLAMSQPAKGTSSFEYIYVPDDQVPTILKSPPSWTTEEIPPEVLRIVLESAAKLASHVLICMHQNKRREARQGMERLAMMLSTSTAWNALESVANRSAAGDDWS